MKANRRFFQKQYGLCLLLIILISGIAGCTQSEGAPVVSETITIIPITETPTITVSEVGHIAQNEIEITPTPLINWETATIASSTAVIARTYEITPTSTLTITKNPEFTNTWQRPPSQTPTRTSTPEQQNADIRLTNPGPYSKVLSPIKLQGYGSKGDDGFLYLQLINSEQQLIKEEIIDYSWMDYGRFVFLHELEFEIQSAVEFSRLLMFTRDSYDRLIMLNSLDLVLQSMGENDLEPAAPEFQPFVIFSPNNEQIFENGEVISRVKICPRNETPVIIELIGEEKEVLAQRLLDVPYESVDGCFDVIVELSAEIETQTSARLTIRQESNNRISGNIVVNSVLLYLIP